MKFQKKTFQMKIISDAEQSILFHLKDLVDKQVGKYCEPSSSVLDNLGPGKGPETEPGKDPKQNPEKDPKNDP